MKILKEKLLLNDLKSTLDVAEGETVLITREAGNPVIIMSLEEYNKVKEELYKKECEAHKE